VEQASAYLEPAVLDSLLQALLGAAAASAVALCAMAATRVRVRIRVPSLPATMATGLSALGATLALSTPPAGADPRAGAGRGPLPREEVRPPWHRARRREPARPGPGGRSRSDRSTSRDSREASSGDRRSSVVPAPSEVQDVCGASGRHLVGHSGRTLGDRRSSPRGRLLAASPPSQSRQYLEPGSHLSGPDPARSQRAIRSGIA
jgi:hypothetical protein